MCTGLESADILGGTIGYAAFEECESIKSVMIGDQVTSIGEFAFADCSNLKSVTIGAGVESIGNCAFQNCPLTEIHCRMEIPLI